MRKANRLVIVVSILALASFAVTLRSFGKNTSGNRRATGAPQQPQPSPQEDFSKNTWELPADADKTKNPVAASPESVAKGKELYLEGTKGNCIFCHGETGSGNEANRPKLRRKPADLSNKERMSSMTDGEVFWKISNGITGIMPAGEKRMSEEERWQVVNYVRTLAKEKSVE
jgi:mono/diheme cytochrome c family protein